MRLLIQRVKSAKVEVDNAITGEIGPGLLVFVGLGEEDAEADNLLTTAAEKLVNYRIFPDPESGKNMERSLIDIGGGILLVSQFTLHADCRKGRRPSFIKALHPGKSEALFNEFVSRVRTVAPGKVETGIFGAMMNVSLVNDGPVTIWIDTQEMPWG